MTDINLHKIFRILINNDDFLITKIEKNDTQKTKKKKGMNLVTDIIAEYKNLLPYESQPCISFTPKMRQFIMPDFIRFGIKCDLEKDLSLVNISFLNSLNMLLRPDLRTLNIDIHIEAYVSLEAFISHKLQRNYQINKTKNTQKVKQANKKLIENIANGQITHNIIGYITNVFEINLLIFDFNDNSIRLYWTNDTLYSHLNLFKNILCMSLIKEYYEPIIYSGKISNDFNQQIYKKIFANINDVIFYPELSISFLDLIYIDTWNIENKTFLHLIDAYAATSKRKRDANK